MKLGRTATPVILAVSALLTMVSGKSPHVSGAMTEAPSQLPLGTIKTLGSTACPPGVASNASCTALTVSCPALPDIGATLAVALPSGTAVGTIILHGGGPGTKVLNSGFADAYVADGFKVVQLSWASDWASAANAGVKSAACRPATVFKAIFSTIHQGSRTAGFCGQGISGGGGALGYSLAYYGLSNYFDYVVIAGGPGVSRMDYGCDPPLYTGGPRDLCPLLPNAIFAYPSGKLVNGWEGTTSCASKHPLQQEISRWTTDSLVSSTGNYSYPKTAMSWYFCVTPPAGGGSTGQGTFLIDQVKPKNAPADVNCYSGVCQAEAVWQDPNAFNTTLSEMLAQCVPNH